MPEHAYNASLGNTLSMQKGDIELPSGAGIVCLAEPRTLSENIDVCARFSFDRSYLYSVRVEQCLSKIL